MLQRKTKFRLHKIEPKMLSSLIFCSASLVFGCLAVARENVTREVIPLWPGVAPGSEEIQSEEKTEERGDSNVPNAWVTQVKKPRLEVIEPTTNELAHTAVVICPGGGYGGLAYDKEGIEIGQWLAQRGVTAFVLKYRHGGGPHQHPVPLHDVQQALRIVRSQAERRDYASDRIGVMGFSAGGHLAASAATHFDDGDPAAEDVESRTNCRPNFQVLIYPVVSMDEAITHGGSRVNLLGKQPTPELVKEMSNELRVRRWCPPAFIVHASDDGAVPVANSVRYYSALIENNVSAELHVFEKGGHGFGMRQKDLPIGQWPLLLENWLRNRELIL